MRELSQYIVVGISANLVNFFTYYILSEIDVEIFYASLLGYFVGVAISFLGARYWTFRNTADKSLHVEFRTLFKFFCVYWLAGFSMSSIIALLVGSELLDKNLSWVIGATFAVAANYLAQKYFIFRIPVAATNSHN